MVDRRNHFNLLRLALAAGVVISHAFELVDGNRAREPLTALGSSLSLGEVAVDGFFLLSGYLIVQSWLRLPQLGPYLRKRVLRIYPAFIVATLIGACVVGPLASSGGAYWTHADFARTALDALLLRPTQTPTVFAGLPYPAVNGAMWTIRYEFVLYLAVPLLLGPHRPRRARWLIATAAVLGLHLTDQILPLASLPGLNPQLGLHATIMARLAACFLIGGCFYLWRDRFPTSPTLALVATALVVLALPHRALAEPVLAVCGGYLLIRGAHQHQSALAPIQSWPDVSYGLYLYGWPIQQLLHWHFPALSSLTLMFATLTLGLLAGWLSWHAVEQPALRLRPAE